MAFNFKKQAIKATTLSDIYEGRNKIEEKAGTYHAFDFDIVSGENGKAYAVVAVSETEFINAATVLSDVFIGFVDAYEGDIDQCREDFRNSGGFAFKLTKRKSKEGGRSYWGVEII